MKKRLNKSQKLKIVLFIIYCLFVIYSFFINLNKLVSILMFILFSGIYVLYKKRRENNLKNSTIKKIDNMTGEEFEEFLQVAFKNMGYKTMLTPITGDYGADLLVKKNGVKTVIQAKRWKSTVGVEAVQQVVASMRYYKATDAMVITNNYYSQNAINLAKANNVRLWDRGDVIKLIKSGECPKCGADLLVRKGPYSEFLGCSNYPRCKYTEKTN
ncbi:restriction endonuclease [Clostridium intestinale]|uniref:Restriction endonuclease n=1 Tax=Clostridium intestinale TaxID=36845 RepID=A0A7D6VTR7_9CLOT|nr:restriction endonuclease [Clostridium intestinale]QLY82286.1 restriction endonuclease [Clostridium intestinale]